MYFYLIKIDEKLIKQFKLKIRSISLTDSPILHCMEQWGIKSRNIARLC